MTFFPTLPDFTRDFSAGVPALVWTRLIADCETPVSAMLKLMREGEPSFLLESVHGGETRGRYSIIGLDPDIIWRCRGHQAEMNSKGSLRDADFKPESEPSLISLKKLVRESTLPIPESLPPMAAGLIGYLGYDSVKLMETLPDANPDPIGLPDGMFMRPRVMVIFDAAIGEMFLITPLWKNHGFTDAKKAYDTACSRLQPIIQRLKAAAGGRPPLEGGQASPSASREGYQKLAEHKYDQDILANAKTLRKESTEAERKLWALLSGKKLSNVKFRRQHPIGSFIADFYAASARLVIELDGSQHAESDQAAYDSERTAFLKKAGYRIVRFWNNEVLNNIEGVWERIAGLVNTPPDSAVASSALPQGEGAAATPPNSGSLKATNGGRPPLEGGQASPSASREGYPKMPLTFTPNMSRADYHTMVAKAKDYILAGDIFQVVPSQRFSAPFTLPPFSLYRSLRHLNPSPFLFYLHFGSFSLIGSSPEILVRLRDGKVTVRPIAGTRKRGANKAEDDALIADLLADPKEISEHLMLLDLGRNDVGRIAKTGTVKVTERMHVEKYSHVMHIVSNVEGDIDPRFDAIDALIAGFPAGTVSGAPKIRAMEIIDELEPVRRSFYAGCVGYFGAGGGMDTCITLRTGLIKDGMLHVQAGGGVVADSDAEAEYQESCNKARALMRAAEDAGRFV